MSLILFKCGFSVHKVLMHGKFLINILTFVEYAFCLKLKNVIVAEEYNSLLTFVSFKLRIKMSADSVMTRNKTYFF